MKYVDTIELPGFLTLESLDTIEERITGYGTCRRRGLVLTFCIDAGELTLPDVYLEWPGVNAEAAQAWLLRDLMEEIKIELESSGVNYNVDVSKVEL